MHGVCSFTNPVFCVNGSLGDNSPESWSCLARCGGVGYKKHYGTASGGSNIRIILLSND